MLDKFDLEKARKQLDDNYKAEQDRYRQGLEGLELMLKGLEQQEPKLPQPTHYTMVEGGEWKPFKSYVAGNPPPNKTAHAIKFDNGAVFDMVNGWREQEAERLVPRYDNDTFQRAQSIEDYKTNGDGVDDIIRGKDGPSISDQRVVSRELLYKVTKFMIKHRDSLTIGEYEMWENLNNTLATEKPALKAP